MTIRLGNLAARTCLCYRQVMDRSLVNRLIAVPHAASSGSHTKKSISIQEMVVKTSPKRYGQDEGFKDKSQA